MELVNFRDIGGIKTNDGHLVKTKRLLRSGEIVNVDQKSKEELVSDYQLKQVIDLRSQAEVSERPDDPILGVDNINIEVMKGAKTNGVTLHDLARIGKVDYVENHMLSVYEELVLDPIAQKSYGQFLDLLLKNQTGSTLFHCFAGKDRTGVAAALILWLLDVDDDDVMKDYLKTNVDRKAANDIIIGEYQKFGYEREALDALEISLYVKEEYLKKVSELVHDNYGNIFDYAEKALDFNYSKVDQLHNLYVK